MSRRSRYPKTRYHAHIYVEDLDWLRTFYGPGNPSGISIGEAIAEIIHKRIVALKERQQREAEAAAQGSGHAPAAPKPPPLAVSFEFDEVEPEGLDEEEMEEPE